MSVRAPSCLTIFLAIFALIFSKAQSTCLCTASQSNCWPDPSAWNAFNSSIGGRLIRVLPPAAPCHDKHFDQQACSIAQAEWSSPFWRPTQPGAMQESNWEASGEESCFISSPRNSTCFQGSVPVYAVSALASCHVQAAVRFAAAKNLRLVIKNTGHDYIGRSTAAGSFSIWTHNMKNISFYDNFIAQNCGANPAPVSAVKIGAGVQWEELYKAVFQRNKVIVGAAGCASVGAAGGYPQAAGHSVLSPTFGLAADNILEYEVVTANGELVTANSCQNQELFWALRGGGGGTFGVVVSATHRTHPSPGKVLLAFYTVTANNGSSLRDLLTSFASIQPRLSDAGWSGYFRVLSNRALVMAYFLPKDTQLLAAQTLAPFLSYVDAHPSLQRTGSLSIVPSVEAWRLLVMCDGKNSCVDATSPRALIGTPSVLSSRLIPRSIFDDAGSVEKLSEAIAGIVEGGLRISGIFAAGGAVAKPRVDNAVNPAWRRALLLVVVGGGWRDGTGLEEQRLVARNVTAANKPLIDLTPGSGTYMNEADFNEPNWQQSFFGTNYARLKAIKERVDPSGLFRCHHCVGSEEWSDDLNCPRK